MAVGVDRGQAWLSLEFLDSDFKNMLPEDSALWAMEIVDIAKRDESIYWTPHFLLLLYQTLMNLLASNTVIMEPEKGLSG